ncbi:unnamed protein product [Dovyalis caffra]|uniref:Uncharacterized protein n=1 Tax=Dovyalis caffra TaxID=77055 RepID=A0AAV1RPH1_9ROSI|nr:unnamed protein product [Dovyalis caffra]
MEVWCAEIEVQENGEGELWGRVEWFDVVHKVPVGSSIAYKILPEIWTARHMERLNDCAGGFRGLVTDSNGYAGHRSNQGSCLARLVE